MTKKKTLTIKERFTINRVGTFKAATISSNQCKRPGHKRYSYTLEATCGGRLDSDGFIIDHFNLDARVQQAAKHVSSCEIMCKDITRSINRLMLEHGCQVLNIRLTIKPIVRKQVAYMVYDMIPAT